MEAFSVLRHYSITPFTAAEDIRTEDVKGPFDTKAVFIEAHVCQRMTVKEDSNEVGYKICQSLDFDEIVSQCTLKCEHPMIEVSFRNSNLLKTAIISSHS
jgi:hypothetical protein